MATKCILPSVQTRFLQNFTTSSELAIITEAFELLGKDITNLYYTITESDIYKQAFETFNSNTVALYFTLPTLYDMCEAILGLSEKYKVFDPNAKKIKTEIDKILAKYSFENEQILKPFKNFHDKFQNDVTKIQKTLDVYEDDPKYGQFMNDYNTFEQMRASGYVSYTGINELQQLFIKAFKRTVNLLINPSSNLDVLPNIGIEQLEALSEIKKEANGDSKIFFQLLNKNTQLNFQHILDSVINDVAFSFFDKYGINAFDNTKTEGLYKNMYFLKHFAPQFAMLAQSEIKNSLKIKIPILKYTSDTKFESTPEKETTPQEETTLEDISEVDYTQNENGDTKDEINELYADGENEVQSRTQHWQNIFVTDLSKNLSRELQLLFSSIPNSTTVFDKYGYRNYYDSKMIYASIRDACFDCLDAVEMMNVLRSDNFNAPFKDDLLKILERDVDLQIKLFTAMCTTRNKYINIKNNTVVHANELTSNDSMWNMLRGAVSDDNQLLVVHDSNDRTRDADFVVMNKHNANQYKAVLGELERLVPSKKNRGNSDFWYEQVEQNGRKFNRIMYKNAVATRDKVQKLFANIKIDDLIKQRYTRKQEQEVKLTKLEKYLNKTICDVVNDLCNDLGLTEIASECGVTNPALYLLKKIKYHVDPENRNRSYWYENKLEFVINKFKTVLNGNSNTEANGDIILFNNSVKNNPLKALMYMLNSKYSDKLENSSMVDGKLFQTFTYANHINYIMREYEHKSPKEINELRDSFLVDYHTGNFDAWDGVFLNEPWFNSWMKDLLENGGKTYKDKRKFELYTFLAFNNIGWSDLNDVQYSLAQFTMFHDTHLEPGLHSYTLPQMEDKSTAYGITQSAFSTTLENEGFSRLSYREASLFMQELYRIKRTYNQAIANSNNANVKTQNICTLQEITKNGNKVLTPFIDFNAEQGNAKFYFLPALNRLLPYINESHETVISNFTGEEQELIQAMRQYIYGDNDDTLIYESDKNIIPRENLTETLLTSAAKYLHKEAYSEFETWFNSIIASNSLFLEYLQVLNNYYNTSKKASIIQLKNALKDVENADVDALITNIKADTLLMSIIKDKMFFQFYNQQYAGNQILSFFSGDCIQYGNIDNMTKRLSQFVASGLVPTNTILYEYDKDKNLVAKTHKRIVCFNDITGNPFTIPMQKYLRNEFKKKFEQDYDKMENPSLSKFNWVEKQLNDLFESYDDNNSTDGQSLMSIDYLIVYLKSLGKLSKVQEDYLQKVKNVYLAETDEFDKAVKDLRTFLNNNQNVQEVNTLKTQTFTMLSKYDSEYDNNYTRKALQIKTADMLPLDIDDFVTKDQKTKKLVPKENHLLYRLQKWMLENQIDGMVARSTMKVYQPENVAFVDLNAGNLSTDDIIKQMNQKIQDEDVVISVPIADNIYVLETPSEFFGTEHSVGIQFAHLVAQNLDFTSDDVKYQLRHQPNRQFTAVELYDLMNNLWDRKYSKIYDELLSEVRDIENGKGKYAGLTEKQKRFKINQYWSNLLTEELIKSESFSYQSWYGLQLDADGNFNVPLSTPSLFILVQKLFTNIIKNKLIKAPMTGGILIQVAQIDNLRKNWKKLQSGKLTDEEVHEFAKDNLDFQMSYDENGNINGVISMEVEIPLYDPALQKKYMDSDGKINMEKIKKEQPELLDMVCYRIPTEGYCSMFRIHVKRFTNPKSGGNIVLPKAITGMSGSDFDIDKMFFIAPAVDKEGNYINPNENNIKAHDNALLNCYLSILENNSTLLDRFTPQGFTDIESIDMDFSKIETIVNTLYNYGYRLDDNLDRERLEKEQPELYKVLTSDVNFAKSLGKINPNKIKNQDNPGSPLTQARLHVQNSISKSSVGIFANPNTIHSILMHYPINIKVEEGTNITIDGVDLVNSNETLAFSQKYCIDGITTQASQLRQLLAAAVDDAKHPRFANLNINLYTADLICTLIQMGFTIKQAVLFVNQPVVVKMVNDYSIQLMNTKSSYIDFPSYVIETAQNNNVATSFNFDVTTEDMVNTIVNYKYSQKVNQTESIDTIMEEQNGSILPMLFKVAKVTKDFKLVIKKYKVDNVGATSWNDLYSYLKYRLDRDLFEKRVEFGESEFEPTVLEPFDGDSNMVNNKLQSIEFYSDSLMNQLFQKTRIRVDIKSLVELLEKICEQCGRDTLSMRDIRNVISSIQTFNYVNDLELDEQYYYGTNTNQSEFSKNVEIFRAYCNTNNKYTSLFGPDGLIVTKPKILRSKTTVNGFTVINTYLASKEHTFRNAMMNDWEQMFNDNSIIPGTHLKVSDMAMELLNYCILKNGFNINNNSFASIIPYLITNNPKLSALKYCSDLTTLDNANKQNDFIELFLRNNKNLVPICEKINTSLEVVTASELTDDTDNLPDYIKNKNICYKKKLDPVDNTLRYYRCSWLGAKEIAVEYTVSHLYNHAKEYTNIGDYNRCWKFIKDVASDDDGVNKVIHFVKMNPNFEAAIEKISEIAGLYNNKNDILTATKKHFEIFGLENNALMNLINIITDSKHSTSEKVKTLFDMGYNSNTLATFADSVTGAVQKTKKAKKFADSVIKKSKKRC